jgi:rhodanese-related sulfurtransferase
VTTLATAERSAAIRWETSQFSGSAHPGTGRAATGVSPRAAYQLLLHGRAVLVDVRPAAQRRREGEVDPALGPVAVDQLPYLLAPRAGLGPRVLVLGAEEYASSPAAASPDWMRLARAQTVVGGLPAWREAGLPLAERAAA